VSQQCSPNAVPHRDESLMSKEASPLFPPQQQQQQQQQPMSTTTTTLSPTASDIAVGEIIDDRNNKGKGISIFLGSIYATFYVKLLRAQRSQKCKETLMT